MSLARLEDTKKVSTFDLSGTENGFLTELYKEGNKTVAYLTSVKPGMFKGYHLHRVRAARYVILRGKMKIVLYKPGSGEKEEYVLDANTPQRLFIPKDIATGLLNIGTDEAWLINYPDPPYDPDLKDEQVEYALEELEQGIVK
ncbi:MAG: WxcM-like domain-containing protein [Candidatus Levybacteria bacterium]|nr:WxcM-like domain-containing protein [Candidatus Levybacteria bacterium]